MKKLIVLWLFILGAGLANAQEELPVPWTQRSCINGCNFLVPSPPAWLTEKCCSFQEAACTIARGNFDCFVPTTDCRSQCYNLEAPDWLANECCANPDNRCAIIRNTYSCAF